MQIILHLIGLSADIAIRHSIDRRIKCRLIGQIKHPKSVFHLAKHPAGKGTAATQLVFINPRLALVHPHRHSATQRCQGVLGRDILLVSGMPHLVDSGINTVERVICGGARGDTRIITRPA